MTAVKPSDFPCATCPLRARAEKNPTGLLARLWKWHTGWCPGWKAYQGALAAQSGQS
ncbi:MAG TPA: hypothetical protein VGA52_16085 [Anaerolineales bacterium]